MALSRRFLPLFCLLALSAPALAQPPDTNPQEQHAIASARQLGDAFATVAEHVSPSVVAIRVEARVEQPQMPFPFFFGQQGPQPPNDGIARGTGSGVVIRPDGLILTNNHVVDRATRIEVLLQDGRSMPGQVVGTDPATDLAVVRISAQNLPAASFADSRQVRPGQWAIAIGSPFGLDYSVTTGVVSSVGRGGLGMNEIEDYIQTDASINPGNSGGPLVDLDGHVIGINTMIVGRGTGIGFAVSSELARRVADQLIAHGRVRRPWIGVQFQDLTPELASALQIAEHGRNGALIADVVPSGPADRAGLRPGDVVVSIEGHQVREARDLLREVLLHDVGSRLALQVMRNGHPQNVSMLAQERPGHEHDGAAPQPQAQAGGLLRGAAQGLPDRR